MENELTPEQQAIQDRIDQVQPLRDAVDAEGAAAFFDGLKAQRVALIDDDRLFPLINAIVGSMTRLKTALAAIPTEVPPTPAPLPVLQPEG